jgi:hypothetical protein
MRNRIKKIYEYFYPPLESILDGEVLAVLNHKEKKTLERRGSGRQDTITHSLLLVLLVGAAAFLSFIHNPKYFLQKPAPQVPITTAQVPTFFIFYKAPAPVLVRTFAIVTPVILAGVKLGATAKKRLVIREAMIMLDRGSNGR